MQKSTRRVETGKDILVTVLVRCFLIAFIAVSVASSFLPSKVKLERLPYMVEIDAVAFARDIGKNLESNNFTSLAESANKVVRENRKYYSKMIDDPSLAVMLNPNLEHWKKIGQYDNGNNPLVFVMRLTPDDSKRYSFLFIDSSYVLLSSIGNKQELLKEVPWLPNGYAVLPTE